MLFNSWEFLILFVGVFVLYNCLALRAQNVLLLIASYVFYGWWDWRFLSLLLITTVVCHALAWRMEGRDEASRKRLLLIAVAVNLGILGFFKYFNFFTGSAAAALGAVGLGVDVPTLAIVLPVGISFYTFQAVGYVVDVYRRQVPAERNPLTFAVYLAYFPQLVAGPIERASNLLPQFNRPRRVSNDALASGAVLVLVGLVRKVVIADLVAGEVDAAFTHPAGLSSLMLVRATLLFALQIYGDFAGYTDIARGVSRMLGIELMENFRHPYFATSISDFWRRWHISLSTWLRDCLYIPLGGNRGPTWFVCRNLMLTMVLGGLWHGANWTFVVWGALHGLALVAYKLWTWDRPGRDRERPGSLGRAVAGWALTMAVVGVGWVFFRAPSLGHAWEMLRGMAALRGGLDLKALGLPLGVLALLLLIDVPQALKRDHTVFLRWPWLLRGAMYAALVMTVVLLRSGEYVPFIYFQF